MAVKRQVIETRLSDLSGDEAEGVSTNKGQLNGRSFKLDLTPGEQATLEGILAPYFQASDDAKASNGGNTADDEGPAIRKWGRDHGYDVSDKGKLSASLKAAFYAAQAEPGNGQEVVSGNGKAKAAKSS